MLTSKVSYYLQGVMCLSSIYTTHSRYIYRVSTGRRVMLTHKVSYYLQGVMCLYRVSTLHTLDIFTCYLQEDG